MLPIVELRGAVPVGAGLGVPPVACYIAAVLGNILPVPFIILFISKILDYLRPKSKFIDRFMQKRIEMTMGKYEKLKHRSEFFILLVFVAIPLPGTGAWTGALLASLVDMKLKKAFPAILLGVVLAGIVLVTVSYGIKGILP